MSHEEAIASSCFSAN